MNEYKKLKPLFPQECDSVIEIEKRRRKFIIAFQQSYESRGYNLKQVAKILDVSIVVVNNLVNYPSRQFKAPLLAKYFERINHLTQHEVLLLSQLWISGYTDQATRDIVTAKTVLSMINTRPDVTVSSDSP